MFLPHYRACVLKNHLLQFALFTFVSKGYLILSFEKEAELTMEREGAGGALVMQQASAIIPHLRAGLNSSAALRSAGKHVFRFP